MENGKRVVIARTCKDCGQEFQGRPASTIGRCCRWKYRKGNISLNVTPEQRAYISQHYDPRIRGRITELCNKLGLKRWIIAEIAGDMGLTRAVAEFHWSQEEETFLADHVGRKSINWIARKLRRKPSQVASKCKRNHVSTVLREGYTMRSLAACFGVDQREIMTWMKHGLLKGSRRNGGAHPTDPWHFTEKQVLSFVQEHPLAFRMFRADQLWFLDLVFKGRIGQRDSHVEAAEGLRAKPSIGVRVDSAVA